LSATADLDTLLGLPPAERVGPLTRLARDLLDNEADAPVRGKLAAALVTLVNEGVGSRKERLELGETLSRLGDPRLRTPSSPEYWATVPLEGGDVTVGRYPVTTAEYRAFVAAGAYEKKELWSDEGWSWLQATEDPWPVLAERTESLPFVFDNQPVVGVSWWEAQAFAKFHNARLLRFDERLSVTRGAERRPYPWGSPFGDGNANTREEVHNRPCAVGLYGADSTPEGVADLAGNAAEWCEDVVGEDRWYHPGSWDQPSMAAWAKARFPEAPSWRSAGLGFRLARD
jgi:formylglycine-generating enzyme required for sulfatase activity